MDSESGGNETSVAYDIGMPMLIFAVVLGAAWVLQWFGWIQ